ncbi:lysophospholipase a [Moniliophthora roreri MCA 2997]|uniref:Lysophospholipase a n=2 Tax=Moniliophthora roreri TaxID=221103 RepID=V2WUA6_MONRO|nr:lysophospholipase a [Moniliophthora roreri MCA 2997]
MFLSKYLTTVLTVILPTNQSFQAEATQLNWDLIKHVYAFGDSYSFIQGVSGYPNYSFIGDALDPSFTPEELLSNEIIPRNTSSEGSNWLEFLTGCFYGPPSLCEKQLWDFAFAGADIDVALLPRHHNFTIQLVEQVDQWVQYASDILPHPPDETMTFWWIGINDTGDTMHNTSITDFVAFWEKEMTSYFDAVQLAYDTGLKTHLFINVPPGDRAPSRVGNPTEAALAKEHINLYNTALANHTSAFASKNPDAIVMAFDSNAWFNKVLDDPATFGFTNVTGFCTCKDPSGYFWYNSGHPTEQVHRLLAEAIKAQLQESGTRE